MRPAPRSRRRAPTTRQPRYVPRRFVASTSSHSSTSISQNERNSVRAALLTSTWTSSSCATSRPTTRARGRRARTPARARPARPRRAPRPSRSMSGERDLVAVGVQPPRDRLADPTRRSRDDRGRRLLDLDRVADGDRPGSTTSHHTPNGSGSRVGTSPRYAAIAPACRGRGCRYPGRASSRRSARRSPARATTAPPTRTRSPIQPSSACGSTPSTPIVIRKRRPSTGRRPGGTSGASSDAVETSDAPATRPRSTPSPSRSVRARRIGRPPSSESASLQRPFDERPVTGRP